MKLLVWVSFLLACAVGVSLIVGSNDGYVLLVQPPYRIELSLNLLVVLLVVGFASLHGMLRLVAYTLQLPQHVRAYKQARRQRDAHAALLDSLRFLAEGRYVKSEKTAARALELGEDPGLSALVAARAAHKLRHFQKRDYYLAEAERLAPEAEVARLLSQAELLLDARDYPNALQALQRLEKLEPRYDPALRLELKIHQRLGNWEQALAVIGQLEERDAVDAAQLRQIRRQLHQQLLQRHIENREALHAYWKKIPEADRRESHLAFLGARCFIHAGDGDAAAQIIEMSLTRNWDSALAGLYGNCVTSDPLRQLQQAEFWLQNHRGDANLLRSLGKLCLQQELWGKAQSYLEASLALQPNAEAHLALGRMLERMGRQQDACQHYQKSLQYAMQES